MTCWRTYRITYIKYEDRSIDFGLNGEVRLNGSGVMSTAQFIICRNCTPFNNWQEGDHIEVDNDQTRYHDCGYVYSSTSVVRLASYIFDNLYNDYKRETNALQEELNKQKDINRELVLMLNSFSEQMIREIFTDNQYFTEHDLSYCKQKLNRIVDEIGRKEESQTALVAKSSADLSMIQVANLALQQQVEEKTRFINTGAVALQTALNQNQQKDTEITRLNSDLTTTRNQIGQFNIQIATKDNQLTQITNERNTVNERLILTSTQLEDLRTLFNNLQLTNNSKDEKIKKKEEILRIKEKEIVELRTQLGLLSPEEILKSKINLKKRELDSVVRGLSLNRQTVVNLCDAYERLGLARLDCNQEIITSAKNDIKNIEEEFFGTVNDNDDKLYEIYQSCEQIAKWNIELEQFYQQQYQTRQEQPTNQ